MANFKLIYQILTLLDKYLDDEPDFSKLSAAHFKVSEKRFTHIMLMLYETGYIDGIEPIHVGGSDYDFKMTSPSIMLLGMARESVSQALQQPLARCKRGRDYFLVQGDDLAALKRDNPSISSLASSVLLIAESGLRKVCAYLRKAMPAVFSDPPVVDVLPVQVTNSLNTYAAPESNKEIGAWVKDIRGYMDVLDGLLHKYEQKNPVTTQEALKEIMRSVGKDIWEDVVRLTCQKYDLVTV